MTRIQYWFFFKLQLAIMRCWFYAPFYGYSRVEKSCQKAIYSIINHCQNFLRNNLWIYESDYPDAQNVIKLKDRFSLEEAVHLGNIDPNQLSQQFVNEIKKFLTNTELLNKDKQNKLIIKNGEAFYFCRRSDDLIKRFIYQVCADESIEGHPKSFQEASDCIKENYPSLRVAVELDNILMQLGNLFVIKNKVNLTSSALLKQLGVFTLFKYLMDRFQLSFVNLSDEVKPKENSKDNQLGHSLSAYQGGLTQEERVVSILLSYAKNVLQKVSTAEHSKRNTQNINTAANYMKERCVLLSELARFTLSTSFQAKLGTETQFSINEHSSLLSDRLLTSSYESLKAFFIKIEEQHKELANAKENRQLQRLYQRLLLICLNRWVEINHQGIICNLSGTSVDAKSLFVWYMKLFEDTQIKAALIDFEKTDDPDNKDKRGYFGVIFGHKLLSPALLAEELNPTDIMELLFFNKLKSASKAFLDGQLNDPGWFYFLEFMYYCLNSDIALLTKSNEIFKRNNYPLSRLSMLYLALQNSNEINASTKKAIKDKFQKEYSVHVVVNSIPEKHIIDCVRETLREKGHNNFPELLVNNEMILKEDKEDVKLSAITDKEENRKRFIVQKDSDA